MPAEQFTKNGKYLMLALDHRGSFLKLLSPNNPEAANKDTAIALKHDIISAVTDQMSGVLVDPDYGLPALTDITKPFLLPLEESGYTDDAGERTTKLAYTATQLKDWGAGGAKVLIYFNPDVPSAQEQLAISKRAMAEATTAGLPLFLEIRVYDLNAGDKVEPVGDLLLRSLTMFLEADIRPAVYKLEYPDNADNCQRITNMLGVIPWIILTKGASFETFKAQLADAASCGAQGFLAGRALWQEVAGLTGDDKATFLADVLPTRFKQLTEIALGPNQAQASANS